MLSVQAQDSEELTRAVRQRIADLRAAEQGAARGAEPAANSAAEDTRLREALREKTAATAKPGRVTVAPAAVPVVAGPAFRPLSPLEELTAKYTAGKISPKAYHAQRAELQSGK